MPPRARAQIAPSQAHLPWTEGFDSVAAISPEPLTFAMDAISAVRYLQDECVRQRNCDRLTEAVRGILAEMKLAGDLSATTYEESTDQLQVKLTQKAEEAALYAEYYFARAAGSEVAGREQSHRREQRSDVSTIVAKIRLEEPEYTEPFEQFRDYYGGDEPEKVKRRKRVLAGEEEVKMPPYDEIIELPEPPLPELVPNQTALEIFKLFDEEHANSGYRAELKKQIASRREGGTGNISQLSSEPLIIEQDLDQADKDFAELNIKSKELFAQLVGIDVRRAVAQSSTRKSVMVWQVKANGGSVMQKDLDKRYQEFRKQYAGHKNAERRARIRSGIDGLYIPEPTDEAAELLVLWNKEGEEAKPIAAVNIDTRYQEFLKALTSAGKNVSKKSYAHRHGFTITRPPKSRLVLPDYKTGETTGEFIDRLSIEQTYEFIRQSVENAAGIVALRRSGQFPPDKVDNLARRAWDKFWEDAGSDNITVDAARILRDGFRKELQAKQKALKEAREHPRPIRLKHTS
jgi:hypothetical protein